MSELLGFRKLIRDWILLYTSLYEANDDYWCLMFSPFWNKNLSYVKALSNVRNILLLFVTDLSTRWIKKQKIICIPYLYSKCKDCYIQWNDDVCFVLDQHAWLDLYSASSLKQQSVCRYVTSLGHIILIPKLISLCSYP
jgi:hypothetical protein